MSETIVKKIIGFLGKNKNANATKGDMDFSITSVNSIENAKENELTFCNLKGKTANRAIENTQARLIVCSEEYVWI